MDAMEPKTAAPSLGVTLVACSNASDYAQGDTYRTLIAHLLSWCNFAGDFGLKITKKIETNLLRKTGGKIQVVNFNAATGGQLILYVEPDGPGSCRNCILESLGDPLAPDCRRTFELAAKNKEFRESCAVLSRLPAVTDADPTLVAAFYRILEKERKADPQRAPETTTKEEKTPAGNGADHGSPEFVQKDVVIPGAAGKDTVDPREIVEAPLVGGRSAASEKEETRIAPPPATTKKHRKLFFSNKEFQEALLRALHAMPANPQATLTVTEIAQSLAQNKDLTALTGTNRENFFWTFWVKKLGEAGYLILEGRGSGQGSPGIYRRNMEKLLNELGFRNSTPQSTVVEEQPPATLPTKPVSGAPSYDPDTQILVERKLFKGLALRRVQLQEEEAALLKERAGIEQQAAELGARRKNLDARLNANRKAQVELSGDVLSLPYVTD